jgi:hypothetical protein
VADESNATRGGSDRLSQGSAGRAKIARKCEKRAFGGPMY